MGSHCGTKSRLSVRPSNVIGWFHETLTASEVVLTNAAAASDFPNNLSALEPYSVAVVWTYALLQGL